MAGPQSTALFLSLIVALGLLIWRMIVARRPVFRPLAACLAFIPAVAFGGCCPGCSPG